MVEFAFCHFAAVTARNLPVRRWNSSLALSLERDEVFCLTQTEELDWLPRDTECCCLRFASEQTDCGRSTAVQNDGSSTKGLQLLEMREKS